jgi:glycogen phosphorylase
LQDVLQMIAEGRFSPDEPDRYHGLVHRVWHHDYFLVAADFDAYHAAQAQVDAAYADPDRWWKMAALNTARSGFFLVRPHDPQLHGRDLAVTSAL